ncbi:MAG TPA: ferritin-like domain-containing protein [Kofleriaceae bacterium]|nr:ferritin-like domain-containing protein [Kofleriaceae bacterium]
MKTNTETAPTEMGPNRTGIKASPIDSKKTIEGAKAGIAPELISTEPTAIHNYRVSASTEVGPVGTMPPPGTLKGAAKTALKALQGESANVFLDQLAARLAFERSGTRLYDAVLAKFDAGEPHEGGPTRAQLEHIRGEEMAHAALLTECMEELGGDPTAMTPGADIQAVATSGILQVATDPRTTLSQAMNALLIAELADNDSWLVLVDLAERMGQTEMAERFQRALEQEDDHLTKVRAWLTSSIMGQAGVERTEAVNPPPRERNRNSGAAKTSH